MANVEHSNLTDPALHEPKGVAAAASGKVYVADGAASGSWANLENISTAGAAGAVPVSDGAGATSMLRYQGWAYYQDTNLTVGTPTQNIATGVRTKFLCDGGNLTTEKNPSDLVSSLWDTVNHKHVPIAENDIYHLRVSFVAENFSGSTPYVDIELDIGGAIGVVANTTLPILKAAAPQNISWSIPVFTGSTYLANGGTVYITYTGSSTCDIYKNEILIVRESKNYV